MYVIPYRSTNWAMHVKGKRPQAETEIIPFYFLFFILYIYIYKHTGKTKMPYSLFSYFHSVYKKQGESPGKRTEGVSAE